MKRSSINPMPEYFDRYINLVDDIDLITALVDHNAAGFESQKDTFVSLGDKIYAPNKWTVKDIIQHVIDTERVFAYRALRFARNDQTILPGYDEQFFGENAMAVKRTLDDLLEEFSLVRKSTIALFNSFSNEMLLRKGICFNKEMSVAAIGFTLAGHEIHHCKVLKERYYPLL